MGVTSPWLFSETVDVGCAERFVDVVDPDSSPSWAEIELRAALRGQPVDVSFCRLAVVLSAFTDVVVAAAVAEGIRTAAAWEGVGREYQIVDDIFRMFKNPLDVSAVPASISQAARCPLHRITAAFKSVYMRRGMRCWVGSTGWHARKYALLDALERRFPLLPVRYYAANAKGMHRFDEEMAVWIRDRLRARAAGPGPFRKIYDALSAEFDDRRAESVFLK